MAYPSLVKSKKYYEQDDLEAQTNERSRVIKKPA